MNDLLAMLEEAAQQGSVMVIKVDGERPQDRFSVILSGGTVPAGQFRRDGDNLPELLDSAVKLLRPQEGTRGQSESLMHDWTLVDLRVCWAEGLAELTVLDESSSHRSILFKGLREFSADRREHWGPSCSINGVSWTGRQDEEGVCLKIEMQSGGMIVISAAAAELGCSTRDGSIGG